MASLNTEWVVEFEGRSRAVVIVIFGLREFSTACGLGRVAKFFDLAIYGMVKRRIRLRGADE